MEPTEHPFTCPYCWKTISMVLVIEDGSQSYVEDCENCCHPILITYEVEEGTLVAFTAERNG